MGGSELGGDGLSALPMLPSVKDCDLTGSLGPLGAPWNSAYKVDSLSAGTGF